MKDIIYPELSYKINGLCFKVQNRLGRFCKEQQYANALEDLLKEANIKYKREFDLSKLNKATVGGNRVDFLVEGKILVDLKAKRITTREDYYQMQGYLASSGLELGLIPNFRDSYLKPKRVLNTMLHKHKQIESNQYSEHSEPFVDSDRSTIDRHQLSKRQKGNIGEQVARKYLEKKGYVFVEQNYHSRYGEIDLVMMKDDEYVFVEVKLRKNGFGEDSVSWAKREKIESTVYDYFAKREIYDKFWRVDIVSIEKRGDTWYAKQFMDVVQE